MAVLVTVMAVLVIMRVRSRDTTHRRKLTREQSRAAAKLGSGCHQHHQP